jgi:hypothetical protein
LIENEWIRYDPGRGESSCFWFIYALKKVKKESKEWVTLKRHKMDKDLKDTEKEIKEFFEGKGNGIFSEKKLLNMKELEGGGRKKSCSTMRRNGG